MLNGRFEWWIELDGHILNGCNDFMITPISLKHSDCSGIEKYQRTSEGWQGFVLGSAKEQDRTCYVLTCMLPNHPK